MKMQKKNEIDEIYKSAKDHTLNVCLKIRNAKENKEQTENKCIGIKKNKNERQVIKALRKIKEDDILFCKQTKNNFLCQLSK